MIPVTLTVEKSGGNLVFSPHDVKKLNYVNAVSLDGNQVQSDVAEIVIRQSPDSWKSAWNGVHNGCAVWIHNAVDGVSRNEKYFYKSLVRTGKNEFILTVQSPLGRLLSKHPGGLYDGTKSLPTVLEDVLGGVITPVCNPALSRIKVYGWAPYQTRRKMLQDLMFAYGFIIRRDSNQNLYFTVPDSDSYAIPRNAIYIGGSVDYRTGNGYARADVTTKELFIDSGVEEKTLFDNVSSGAMADNLLVTFDSPMHSLTASGGLAIQKDAYGNDKCGVNYAVVSGVGTLKGKPYSMIESVVSVDGDADADPENVLSVPNNAFITTLNAVSVAERLLGVRRAVSVSVSIRRTTQRAGDFVTFTDPFGDERSGYVTELRGEVTSIDKAAAEIICGYAPAWGNSYDAVFLLTPESEADSNQWTVPEELNGKTIRVVLIGGGTGGASGQHGSDDTASGGKKGAPGGGGRIREIRLTVAAGATYTYHCGSGGAGGAPTSATEADEKNEDSYLYVSNSGSAGTATTFTPNGGNSYSSADGVFSGVGFYDTISGNRYAVPGPNAGVGGGAAVGNNGGNGGDVAYGFADTGGRGGNGADALPIFPAGVLTYGSGGSGGHGGGEGGEGGRGNTTEESNTGTNGARGAGGSGSCGQDGAPGCILIYYKANP